MTVTTVTQVPEHPILSQGTPLGLKLFYVMCAVLVVAVLSFNIFKPIKVLHRVSLAPGFSFTNQDGLRKTSEDFRGKLTLYSFTYSACAAGCPQTTSQMQTLRNTLSQLVDQEAKFALVTISLDPQHDTPEIWNAYASQYLNDDGSEVSWDFLTGDALRTRYVVGGGFGLYYQNLTDQAGISSVKFTPRYVLVDGWGIIRAEYRDAQLDMALVLRDIGYLQAEIRNSQGVARYAYEAAHLFRCYP